MAIIDNGAPFAVTANNATSAVATQAAVTGSRHYIYGVSGSSDKAAAKILIKDGTTVIWQDRISNTASAIYYFPVPLKITLSAACSVTVDGTAECNANLLGVTVG
jgi:hypothetical protein